MPSFATICYGVVAFACSFAVARFAEHLLVAFMGTPDKEPKTPPELAPADSIEATATAQILHFAPKLHRSSRIELTPQRTRAELAATDAQTDVQASG